MSMIFEHPNRSRSALFVDKGCPVTSGCSGRGQDWQTGNMIWPCKRIWKRFGFCSTRGFQVKEPGFSENVALERTFGTCFKFEFVQIFGRGLLKPETCARGRKLGTVQTGGGGQGGGAQPRAWPAACASVSGKYLTRFLAVQRRKGKIKWAEKCPLASEVRGRTIMNRAPNAALPRLVLGWPWGWCLEMLVLVKAKCGEKNQLEIGAVFQSVCAHYVINASVCHVIWKSSIN